jgi:hypothetical protein
MLEKTNELNRMLLQTKEKRVNESRVLIGLGVSVIFFITVISLGFYQRLRRLQHENQQLRSS